MVLQGLSILGISFNLILFHIKWSQIVNINFNRQQVDILEHADPPKAQLIGNCRSGGC